MREVTLCELEKTIGGKIGINVHFSILPILFVVGVVVWDGPL